MNYRSVVRAALSGGLAMLVLALLFGHFVADSKLSEMFLVALGGFLVILFSLLLGRSRGLVALWAVLLVVWLLGLYGAVAMGRGDVAEAGKHLPARFALWSVAGLPLAIATEFFLQWPKRQPVRSRCVALGFALWLGLIVVSWQLGSRPLDVGSHLLHNATIAWAVAVMLAPSPVVFSWLFAKRAWASTPQGYPKRADGV